jgi:uncharacterized integral membrane protein
MTGPQPDSPSPRRWTAFFRFAARHPWGVVQGVVLALIVVVIFQNIEPTSVDFLFWSILSVPKIVLILISMLIGAALWEVVRRRIRRRTRTPAA